MEFFIKFLHRISWSELVSLPGLLITLMLSTGVLSNATIQKAHHPTGSLQDSPEVAAMMTSSVTVLIQSPTLKNIKEIAGAGVIVRAKKKAPLVILTANHVVDNLPDSKGFINIRQDGKVYQVQVKVTAALEDEDLALLETEDLWDGSDIAAKLAETPPRRGDTVWVTGTPNNVEWNLGRGVISSERPCMFGDEMCYRIDAVIYYGNSGGGVFTNTGKLIGINGFAETEERSPAGIVTKVLIPGGGGVISWYCIKAFLKDALK